MDDFSIVNEIYAQAFGEHKPARSTIEISKLPKDVLVEIELIAKTNKEKNKKIVKIYSIATLESFHFTLWMRIFYLVL